MRNAWIPQPREGKGMPLLLIPEYSGINKGQRVPDRSKTAHRKPLVKCFLTANTEIRFIMFFATEALYSQQKRDWELTVA